MLIQIIDIEKGYIWLDIPYGTTIGEVKNMIKSKWTVINTSFELYHKEEELKDDVKITLDRFGTNLTFTLYSSDIYYPRIIKGVEMNVVDKGDDTNLNLCKLVHMTVDTERHSEMLIYIRLFPLDFLEPIINEVFEIIENNQVSLDLVATLFCTKVLQLINDELEIFPS